ncbi:Dipeptidyl aminopeptidase BIII [Streptomyces griseorubiginosus]|uniref:Dipeptidyl aminopeptidase BIII n=1 Tax=Streptomyces griseorubiginosus TaxID=67304 RepID=A0AAI8L9Y2_9ACTN|nr:Dipeptidyl aminopeptidase BIII [Streptomyces griseorubiginosus]
MTGEATTGTAPGVSDAPIPPGASDPLTPPGASDTRPPPLPAQEPAPPEPPETHRAAAPAPVPLPEAEGPRDAVTRLRAHGCWYPSADPDGTEAAFICDRGGVPQLWAGPVDGEGVRLLDSSPDPVKEVSWSPDGRWIAYTTAPGGGEHSRVLCVRPDGTGRRLLAGADPDTSAYLGCWARDGSAVAVTLAAPAASRARRDGLRQPSDPAPAHWTARDGRATLLGTTAYATGPGGLGTTAYATGPGGLGTTAYATGPGGLGTTAHAPGPGGTPAARTGAGLSAYLIDPDGLASPVLLATEPDAPTLRVCDLTADGRLALLRRGPRGRREAVVRRVVDTATTFTLPVADGDQWIGRFSPDGRTLWLRSDAGREYAALFAVALDAGGTALGTRVVAERADSDLDLLTLAHDGRTAVLAWNVRGASELDVVETSARPGAPDTTGPLRPVPLPHEVVTRITAAGAGRLLLALSGSQRRPGVWWAHEGVSLLRTPWSARDEDTVPPGRPPVRPVLTRLTARDGLPLGGWYYRAPGRAPQEPAPCVVHLHGGPEDQERPVFDPLYHELLGRGLDVFAPDVRGSGGHGRSFVDADLGTGRFAALDDVADCAAHAVTAGPADPTRLAVMGRSYGGYLTFASLVWHPDLFRTGVAVCGMSDLLTFFAGTEPWIAESAAHKYGHPERDRELLRTLSPMSRIDALRAPLLAVHGEHDTNVPPGESEQFVRAARERGVPAELLVLRDEGHDFLRAENRRLFRRAAGDWMERHLRP